MGFTGFYWVLLGFIRFHWVLLGSNGFYWVFTEFYRVLRTEFHWLSLLYARLVFYLVFFKSSRGKPTDICVLHVKRPLEGTDDEVHSSATEGATMDFAASAAGVESLQNCGELDFRGKKTSSISISFIAAVFFLSRSE